MTVKTNMDDKIIQDAINYIETLFKGNADGHDAAHSLRVYHNAQRIVASYPECDQLLVSLASLLHDVDDHKLFNTQNNANARQFLNNSSIDPDTIDQISKIINGVSFSNNKDKTPDTLEGKIVQDADRLDALGAIGIARTFAYGGKNGRALEESVQHFYDKLLLLKDTMNTEEAREMAEGRHAFLEMFIEQLKLENYSLFQ